MLDYLKDAIDQLPDDHLFQKINEWHIRQIARQIRLRARSSMIPPYCEIEDYRGQGKLLTNLYIQIFFKEKEELIDFLKHCDLEDIRKLMWQRFTATSKINMESFPPTKHQILQQIETNGSVEQIVKEIGNSKHNCEIGYWDLVMDEIKITRSPKDKTELVQFVIDYFLEEFTWWNTYTHEGLGLIYEIRDRSGHGIRWTLPGLNQIQFVEPQITDDIKFRETL